MKKEFVLFELVLMEKKSYRRWYHLASFLCVVMLLFKKGEGIIKKDQKERYPSLKTRENRKDSEASNSLDEFLPLESFFFHLAGNRSEHLTHFHFHLTIPHLT